MNTNPIPPTQSSCTMFAASSTQQQTQKYDLSIFATDWDGTITKKGGSDLFQQAYFRKHISIFFNPKTHLPNNEAETESLLVKQFFQDEKNEDFKDLVDNYFPSFEVVDNLVEKMMEYKNHESQNKRFQKSAFILSNNYGAFIKAVMSYVLGRRGFAQNLEETLEFIQRDLKIIDRAYVYSEKSKGNSIIKHLKSLFDKLDTYNNDFIFLEYYDDSQDDINSVTASLEELKELYTDLTHSVCKLAPGEIYFPHDMQSDNAKKLSKTLKLNPTKPQDDEKQLSGSGTKFA